MSSKIKVFLIWLTASALVGLAARPLVPEKLVVDESKIEMAALDGGLGGGLTLAFLGGYRNIASNLVWISMYTDWQYRRIQTVIEKIELALALSPESLNLWIDGSRIIANDAPVWEVGDDFMDSLFSSPEGVAVRQKYGERALDFLEKAPENLSENVRILVEKGSIYWRRIGDLDQAIDFFEQAASKAESPYFVKRVYAELLVRNGQVRVAYEYLKKHYATLPDDDIAAMKPLVRTRIQQLEQVLKELGD